MSILRPLKSIESGRLNWQRINQIDSSGADTRSRLVRMEQAMRSVGYSRAGDPRGQFFPFRIYPVFSTPTASALDWLRYRVRAGSVLGVEATGTDGVNGNPDEDDILDASDGNPYITVAEDCEKFWFWLELDLDSQWVLRWGDDPTASSYPDTSPLWESDVPWDTISTDPVPDSDHIPIGFIDTHTFLAEKRAVVRQLLRGDVTSSGGGGGGGGSSVQQFRLKSVEADYLVCRAFDGSGEGDTDILIAKDQKHRNNLASAVVEGVNHTYTYEANPDSNGIDNTIRTDTTASAAELQQIRPAWVLDDIVYAATVDHTSVSVGGTEIRRQYLGSFRQWARVGTPA